MGKLPEGTFMIETHTCCDRLNSNENYPSYSLINKKLVDIEKLKIFLVEIYKSG